MILLADHFVTKSAQEMGKEVKRISTPALNMLMAYHWPGNVRELENVIERSVILSDDGVIHGYNLPPSLQTSAETGTSFGCGLEAKIQAVEYEMIVEALKTPQWQYDRGRQGTGPDPPHPRPAHGEVQHQLQDLSARRRRRLTWI